MISNLILIVVVLGVAFAIVRRFITKRQNEESDEKMQVDDRTYTLEMMISFVKRRLDEITKINLYDIGLSEEELKRRKNKKYELKKALKGCTYGDVNDKKYIKELIYDMLYNEYGVADINSTPNNNVASENDMGAADVIIAVSTGGTILTYVILAIINTILIAVAIKLMIKNKIINIKKESKQ